MVQIVAQLEESGHPDEAQAMLAITHVIGSHIKPIDTTNGWGRGLADRMLDLPTRSTCLFNSNRSALITYQLSQLDLLRYEVIRHQQSYQKIIGLLVDEPCIAHYNFPHYTNCPVS